MKHLFFYLLTAAGLVLLLEAFDRAPVGASVRALDGVKLMGSVSGSAPGCSASAAQSKTVSTARTTSVVSKVKFTPADCAVCHKGRVEAFFRTTHPKTWEKGMDCEQCHGDV